MIVISITPSITIDEDFSIIVKPTIFFEHLTEGSANATKAKFECTTSIQADVHNKQQIHN
jgi:hypothetical protein